MAVVNLTSPYDQESAKIARSQKYAEMLQQQAMEPSQTFSYNGIQTPIPKSAGLAKILQGLTGVYMQNKADEDTKALGEKAQAEAGDIIGKMLSTERPGVAEIAGSAPAQMVDVEDMDFMRGKPGGPTAPLAMGAALPTPGGMGAAETPGTAAIPARAKTTAERYADVLAGNTNPVTAPLAAQMFAQMAKTNEPYTLAKGAIRIGADGKIIAENTASSPSDIPMSIKEWNEYQKMSPQNQDAYREMKRATKYLDTGDAFVPSPAFKPQGPQQQNVPPTATSGLNNLPSELSQAVALATPQQQPGPVVKQLDPRDRPVNIQAAAEAKVTGESGAKLKFNMMGLGDIINEAEGVLNGTVKPTGSGVGVIVDALASTVGYSAPGSSEATALRAIGGALVAKMPRMEGPQSVADLNLYKEMAGTVGDAAKTVKDRKAALAEVKKLWLKYDKSSTSDGSPSGAQTGTPEGTKATNPQTGAKVIFKGGKWQPL